MKYLRLRAGEAGLSQGVQKVFTSVEFRLVFSEQAKEGRGKDGRHWIQESGLLQVKLKRQSMAQRVKPSHLKILPFPRCGPEDYICG